MIGSREQLLFILSPLRQRPITLLWGGQVLSAIGDEFYKVALVWVAIRLIGKDAGFLVAVEAGAILFSGLIVGPWAERWDPRRTMIFVDVVRAAVLLCVPLIASGFCLSIPVLIAIAIIVSSLSTFFDPALQSLLPEIVRAEAGQQGGILEASNGLMEATRRLARILGPGLISLCSAFLPLIHFFTLDALSFFLSAISIWAMHRFVPSDMPLPARAETPHSAAKLWAGLRLGFGQISENKLLYWMVVGCFFTWGLWSLSFNLGLALLVEERNPGNLAGNLGGYGILVAAYGIGNFGSNLLWGSLRIRRPQLVSFLGTVVIGAGFTAIALAPSLSFQLAAAAFCGIGGPMEDLSFLSILQANYRGPDIARIFRLRMALAFGGIFVCFLLSPLVFRLFSVSAVIHGCGVALCLFGLLGLLRFRRYSQIAG